MTWGHEKRMHEGSKHVQEVNLGKDSRKIPNKKDKNKGQEQQKYDYYYGFFFPGGIILIKFLQCTKLHKILVKPPTSNRMI